MRVAILQAILVTVPAVEARGVREEAVLVVLVNDFVAARGRERFVHLCLLGLAARDERDDKSK